MCYHQAISNSCLILSCAVVETNKRGKVELIGLLTTHEVQVGKGTWEVKVLPRGGGKLRPKAALSGPCAILLLSVGLLKSRSFPEQERIKWTMCIQM